MVHSDSDLILHNSSVLIDKEPQLDGNLIKPLLFGKSMNIHPLTIILVLIGAGSVAGILGMLICIPVYAVIKTIILNIRKIYLLRRMEHVSEKLDSPKVLEETSE